MERRKFINALGGASGLLMASPLLAASSKKSDFVAERQSPAGQGVWKFPMGTPEQITPQRKWIVEPSFEGSRLLPTVENCPVVLKITSTLIFVILLCISACGQESKTPQYFLKF